MQEPIGFLSGVFCLLKYSVCLALFSHILDQLRLVVVFHEVIKYLGKTCIAKRGMDLI